MNCDYCGRRARLVTGRELYPSLPDLAFKRFHRCDPCDAHVGCHPGTTNPLGRLANASLRRAKRAAHKAFDPLWQEGGMSRTQAYAWLSRTLGIAGKDCHVGMFDEATCARVVEACAQRRAAA